MEKLYDSILAGIKKSPNLYQAENYQNFEAYLASLKEPAKNLWNLYRCSMVNVAYSDLQIQAVYLIRYYPHYVQMTLEILRLFSEIFTFEKHINACFFGAGPCPEIAGLAQFLAESCPKAKFLTVYAFDKASETWKPSRSITKNFILPNLWDGKILGKVTSLNLCSNNAFLPFAKIIRNSHIFCFQNCLNEIWNTSTTQQNIEFLLDCAPANSYIIIADLIYEQNRRMIQSIKEIADQRSDYEIIGMCEKIEIRSLLQLPSIVEQNLLTNEDKLKPKKWIKFSFLVIRKCKG